MKVSSQKPGFAACLLRDENQEEGAVQALRTALSAQGVSDFHLEAVQGAVIACSGRDMLARGENACAYIAGRVRWITAELQSVAFNEGDAAALIKGYKQHKERVLEHIHGNFLLFVMDQGALFAANDRFSTYPIYHTTSTLGLLVSDTLDPLVAHPGVNTALSAQGMYNYVYFHMIPSPGTAFEGIHKLPPASILCNKDARQEPHCYRYWQPKFSEDGQHSVSSEVPLLDVLSTAVSDAGLNRDDVGSFLSGGLDSSTVTGLLSQVTAGKARAFTIGFDQEAYDETPYARSAAAHFDTELVEYFAQPEDVMATLPLIAGGYSEPFGNSSAVPAYCCARRAREAGIGLLLAGDGGDELFAGNARYGFQQLFEIYRGLPAGFRHNLIEPVVRHLPSGIKLFRWSQSFVAQANIPLPDRLEGSYNFVNRPEFHDLFLSGFREQVDVSQPLSLQQRTFWELDEASILNRMLYMDWKFTLADNDLVKVTKMCEMAGVEVAFPMLDERVVDLSCRVPSRQKLKIGRLRHYYRKQMKGFLPDSVLQKSKHGFGLPFGLWMNTSEPLSALVSDSLHALGGRGIFSRDVLDRTLKLHREGHAGYYGELIWVLMVLELWLQETERRFKLRCSF